MSETKKQKKTKRKSNKKDSVSAALLKSLSSADSITPRTKYAMKMTGIVYDQVKEAKREGFNDDKLSAKEQDIAYDFYMSHRLKLIQELDIARKQVIKQRLCDSTLIEEEEQEHLTHLLEKEEIKFERLMKRQDKETKRLLNEQMDEMEKFEQQKHKFDKYNEKLKRKENELEQIKQEKSKKKEEIMRRRENAELKTKEIEKQKFLESLRQREENEKKLKQDRERRYNQMQKMLRKRVSDYDERAKKVVQMNQELEKTQIKKTNQLDERYYNELNRYNKKIHQKVDHVRTKREEEFKRHRENIKLKQQQDKEKLRQLREKQEQEEQRLKEFQEQREKELNTKKKRSNEKIASRLDNARGGEAARLKKIEDDAARAEANRLAFLRKKQEEERLKHFVSNLKKQAMMEQVEQNARAKEFRNEQLMMKAKREDERRIADLQLKEHLRNQRIMNDTQVKIRQTHLKEEMIEANKSGDIDKLKDFLTQIEKDSEMRSKSSTKHASMMTSPLRSARSMNDTENDQPQITNESQIIHSKGKNKKVSIVHNAKTIESSVARSNQLNKTAIKASLLRQS